MENVLYLSLVTASISFTVTETKLFAPAREWARGKGTLLGELLSCGYCFGYWVAFGLVAMFAPSVFSLWLPLDYFLTALVIAWLSAFQWGAMCWLMKRAEK
jgi:hypothetical protein